MTARVMAIFLQILQELLASKNAEDDAKKTLEFLQRKRQAEARAAARIKVGK